METLVFFGGVSFLEEEQGSENVKVWLVKLTVHLERAIEETSRKERKKKLSCVWILFPKVSVSWIGQ